jgi:hypothetical protein
MELVQLPKLAGKPRCRVKALLVTAECAQAVRGGKERTSYDEAYKRKKKATRVAEQEEGSGVRSASTRLCVYRRRRGKPGHRGKEPLPMALICSTCTEGVTRVQVVEW